MKLSLQKAANTNGPKQCSRCQEIGHTSGACQNDIVCLQCHQYGHKRSECTADPVFNQDPINEEVIVDDENNLPTPSPPTPPPPPPPPPPRSDSENAHDQTPTSPTNSPANNQKMGFLRRSRTLTRNDLKLRSRSSSVSKRIRSPEDSRHDSSLNKQARLNSTQQRLEDKENTVESDSTVMKDIRPITPGSRFSPFANDNDNADFEEG